LDSRGDIFTQDALAWAWVSAGKFDEAQQHINLALSEGTKDARLFLHAAIIAWKTGKPEEARRWARQAAASQQTLLPCERAYLDNLPLAGRVMARSGN